MDGTSLDLFMLLGLFRARLLSLASLLLQHACLGLQSTTPHHHIEGGGLGAPSLGKDRFNKPLRHSLACFTEQASGEREIL